jgi:hypothetical protein
MQDSIKYLITTIIGQAKYFLEDADEFYPFGSAITKDNKLRPIGIYLDDDNPSSSRVLDALKYSLFEGLKRKDYLLAAIGVDVFIKIDNEKKSALQIKVYDQNAKEIKDSIFHYFKQNGTYIFQEIGNN